MTLLKKFFCLLVTIIACSEIALAQSVDESEDLYFFDIEDEEISEFVNVARLGLERAEKFTADDAHHDDLHRHAEEQIVLQSIENLKTYPSIWDALTKEKIRVRGWLFDMSHADILEYSEEKAAFVSLTPHSHSTHKAACSCGGKHA